MFPDDVLQLNGRDIPSVNNVKYLGVTFEGRKKWRHHIERTVAEALRMYVRTFCVFEVTVVLDYLNANACPGVKKNICRRGSELQSSYRISYCMLQKGLKSLLGSCFAFKGLVAALRSHSSSYRSHMELSPS